MHSLKFVEACAIDAVRMKGANLSSPACQKCLGSFQENLRLALGIAASPGWAAMITMQWNMATNNAACDIWGPEWIARLEKASPEEVRKWECGKHETMRKIVSENDPLLHEHLEVMTRQTDELAWRCGPFVHSMMEGLLKAVCIQAWTAIEVLLEDLHGEVIDIHSTCFSSEVLEVRKRTKTKSKGRKFYFRSRDGFRDSYAFAFNDDLVINGIVKAKTIDALAAVRHLLVHRCGTVDKEFKEEFDCAPETALSKFPNIAIGYSLPFDGEIVRQLVDDAITEGYRLIGTVDTWLMTKHYANLTATPA